ncbi:YybH family protein [Ferruginibacter albus]|uniref:YybH family protein n=1 Tax=Ferruginibacter albus TaxID=2875540 RepID=UPI001CC35004|nr:DUF4440 domain-containing protein [Ferruginibacter albus]UAY53278.1 DUF4440 domain-containing protein [Ferruginibacter albus]
MKKIILSLFIVSFFLSCKNRKPPAEEQYAPVTSRTEIIETDKAFSKLSEEKGVRAAFMEYIDSAGVLLRPRSLPIEGADAIDYISQDNDTTIIMTWEPTGAAIAKSGDLGYTYGTYLIRYKNKDSVQKGTYLSIWKKQADGKWKFVLDTGNEGLSE